MTRTLLSLGHGYSSAHIARALPPDWRILASTRDPARAAAFAAQGLEPVLWTPGGDDTALRAALARASHMIVSIPPGPGRDREGDPALAALAGVPAPHLRWLGYLSATSVHGDTEGAWLDDFAPPAPTTGRGRARLAAEQGWTAWARARGAEAALIRIAGIYGPGRSVWDQIARGTARRLVKPGHVFNRIHVEDLGAIVAAAARLQATGPILAADGVPAAPEALLDHACAALGRPPLPTIPVDGADLSPMARSFFSETKRLRPTRLAELGVNLRYPDWRAGLDALKPRDDDAPPPP